VGDHDRGTKKFDFCAEPRKPECDCGNNYYEVCDPGWSNYTYPQLVNAANPYTYPERYEAHHIVCVSSVMSKLLADETMKSKNHLRVITETVWCINRKINMKAMPLFGHTVKHYCAIAEDTWRFSPQTKAAPDFEDIPQHDWDHDGEDAYLHEVDEALEGIVEDIQEAGHDFKGENLEAELNDQSKAFRTLLRNRGKRNGGTHKSWLEARDDQDSKNWCSPFSMASTASQKGFPVPNFNKEIQKWIDRISSAIGSGV
jgi:hypothetical protein